MLAVSPVPSLETSALDRRIPLALSMWRPGLSEEVPAAIRESVEGYRGPGRRRHHRGVVSAYWGFPFRARLSFFP